MSTFPYSSPRPAWFYPKILVLTPIARCSADEIIVMQQRLAASELAVKQALERAVRLPSPVAAPPRSCGGGPAPLLSLCSARPTTRHAASRLIWCARARG